MNELDPRLRADSSSQSYEAPRYSTTGYPDVQQNPSAPYEHIQTANTPTSSQNQHNQYHGMPTPQSYPASGQNNNSDYDHSPTAGNPSDPNDLKRPRACEACRQLKVRCEPDDNHPTGSCRRCAKAGRQCVVTQPSRKRQKKTDSRVAELEKKIDALTASLVASRNGQDVGDIDPLIAQQQMAELQASRNQLYEGQQWQSGPGMNAVPNLASPTAQKPPPGLKRKMSPPFPPNGQDVNRALLPPAQPFNSHLFEKSVSPLPRTSSPAPYVDVIERGIIDLKTAHKIFDRYINQMCHLMPVVMFPPGTKAEDVRRNKPLLFLALLAIGCAVFKPDVQSQLVTEATRMFAEKIVYRGEKSLELVQTVQLMTIWYQPPERYEELNFNQLIHLAAVMALDLGMGKRAKPGAFAVWREYMDKKSQHPDPNSAETRRTWLGCYYLCSNAAMSLRRPLLVRWTAYNDECIEVLSSSSEALPSDKWLCHMIKAQHISEDVGFQFSMDDPASMISLNDTKTQYHLKAFERQLSDWKSAIKFDSTPREGWSTRPTRTPDSPLVAAYPQTEIAKHSEAIINLYTHEISMHHNHNIDDFKPPYNIAPEDGSPDPDQITTAHIDSLIICLHSIHQAFDAFIEMDISVLRALPTLFFVRNSYAAVALIKMYSSVTARDSQFATIFKVEDLRVEHYLSKLIEKLTQVAEGNQSRVARKFSFIFNMLKGWHAKRNEGELPRRSGKPIEHLAKVFSAAPVTNKQQQQQHANQGQDRRESQPQRQHSQPQPQPQSGQQQYFHNPNIALAPGQTPAKPRSGLQMLSDAAMGGIKAPVAPPSSNDPLLAATGQPQQGWNPFTSNGNPGVLTPGGAIIGDHMMNYGLAGPDLDSLGFTPDELMTMGSLMEDPGWMNFGLEQGGWSFGTM